MNKYRVSVVGAGSWGTALATVLDSNGHNVRIWDRDDELLDMLASDRENKKYLPEFKISDSIVVCRSLKDCILDSDIVVFAVPAQHFRSALSNGKEYLKEDALIINVSKGIEQNTLALMSDISKSVAHSHKFVVLSGPSHAEEVIYRHPTVVAVSSEDEESAKLAQDIFMNERFRVYTLDDVVGVELGGSLKNIIALGAGISDGLGFGDNAKAAIMTRGLYEVKRLGVKMGARPETFSGLTGIGDLIVTCTSMHSRNRRCGILIGKGVKIEDALKDVGMIVEGIFTVEAAYELSKNLNVEMPITEAIYNIIHGKINANDALITLMNRERKHEI